MVTLNSKRKPRANAWVACQFCRVELRKMLEEHKNVSDLARRYGIASNKLHYWLRMLDKERDDFQVKAFQTMFKAFILQGEERIIAVGLAIAATSDSMTEAALKRDPDAIQKWTAMNMRR